MVVHPSEKKVKRIQRLSRFFESVVDFNRPEAYEIIGNVGQGKGALMSLLGEYFYVHNHLVYDLLAADSGHENLCWAIPGAEGIRYPILWVHSPYTDVYIPDYLFGWVRETTDLHLRTLAERCVLEKRILVFDNASFDSNHYRHILLEWFSEIKDVNSFLFKKYRVRGAVLLRELYKLLPSTGRVSVGDSKIGSILNQAIKTMFRERRHGRLHFFGDIQRDIDLDKAVRTLMTTRFIRRSPERALEPDVVAINRNLESYYEHSSKSGVFMPAVKATYPCIDVLSKKQMWVQTSDGKSFFKTNIPLPNFGYVDTFEHDIEDILGVKIVRDHKAMREYRMSAEKEIDYNLWMKRIKIAMASQMYMTPIYLLKEVEWEAGVDSFIALLKKLTAIGFMVKLSQKAAPVMYALGEDLDGDDYPTVPRRRVSKRKPASEEEVVVEPKKKRKRADRRRFSADKYEPDHIDVLILNAHPAGKTLKKIKEVTGLDMSIAALSNRLIKLNRGGYVSSRNRITKAGKEFLATLPS